MNKIKKSRFSVAVKLQFILFAVILLGVVGAYAASYFSNDVTNYWTADNLTVNNTGIFKSNLLMSPINASNFYYGSSPGFSGLMSSRPLVSNGNVVLTVCSVGCNYTTIQAAVNNVPFILRHTYNITVANGNYPEDLWIPPFTLSDIVSGNITEGSAVALNIRGNRSDWSGVKIRSIQVTGVQGAAAFSIDSVQVYGTEPTSDENVSVSVYGSSNPVFSRMIFNSSSTAYGLMCYSSTCTFSSVNFTTTSYRAAVLVKHNGQILLTDGGVNGNFTTNFIDLQGGIVLSGPASTFHNVTVGSSLVNTPRGFYLDSGASGGGKLYGVKQFSAPLSLANVTSNNIVLGDGVNGPLISFDVDRDWLLSTNGSGATTSMFMQSLSDGKVFDFYSPSNVSALSILLSDSSPMVNFYSLNTSLVSTFNNLTTYGNAVFRNTASKSISFQRLVAPTESGSITVDDNDFIFNSTQDESSGDSGGFKFFMDPDSISALFKINNRSTNIFTVGLLGNITSANLKGSGPAFLCLDGNGMFIRSSTNCTSFSVDYTNVAFFNNSNIFTKSQSFLGSNITNVSQITMVNATNNGMDRCTLVNGVCTISNTRVTANTNIFCTEQSLGTVTLGQGVAVSGRLAGVSYNITSGSLTDTSIVACILVEPSQ